MPSPLHPYSPFSPISSEGTQNSESPVDPNGRQSYNNNEEEDFYRPVRVISTPYDSRPLPDPKQPCGSGVIGARDYSPSTSHHQQLMNLAVASPRGSPRVRGSRVSSINKKMALRTALTFEQQPGIRFFEPRKSLCPIPEEEAEVYRRIEVMHDHFSSMSQDCFSPEAKRVIDSKISTVNQNWPRRYDERPPTPPTIEFLSPQKSPVQEDVSISELTMLLRRSPSNASQPSSSQSYSASQLFPAPNLSGSPFAGSKRALMSRLGKGIDPVTAMAGGKKTTKEHQQQQQQERKVVPRGSLPDSFVSQTMFAATSSHLNFATDAERIAFGLSESVTQNSDIAEQRFLSSEEMEQRDWLLRKYSEEQREMLLAFKAFHTLVLEYIDLSIALRTGRPLRKQKRRSTLVSLMPELSQREQQHEERQAHDEEDEGRSRRGINKLRLAKPRTRGDDARGRQGSADDDGLLIPTFPMGRKPATPDHPGSVTLPPPKPVFVDFAAANEEEKEEEQEELEENAGRVAVDRSKEATEYRTRSLASLVPCLQQRIFRLICEQLVMLNMN